MEEIKDLTNLLWHHLQTLYSAEELMMITLPSFIKRARHPSLKNALKHHLTITGEQIKRLEQIPQLLSERENGSRKKKSKSVTAAFIKQHSCKGMSGLIDEANELLEQRLSKDVTDAAIIACIQKMEHYEICTYGTAISYAAQLHHPKAEALLQETLDEEYDADDLLTALATASFNKEAEPKTKKATDEPAIDTGDTGTKTVKKPTQINERSISSPGGRSGTSHRRYPSGESRGH